MCDVNFLVTCHQLANPKGTAKGGKKILKHKQEKILDGLKPQH